MVDAEINDLRQQCVASLYSCAKNVAMFLEGQEMKAEFDKLRSCLEKHCIMEARQDVAIQALGKAQSESDCSNLESLQDRFESHLNNLARKHQDTSRHPYIVELNKIIEMGLVKHTENLDESDVAITQTQDKFIDPITKRPVVDPVKNSVCGHVYDKDTIMELINMKKKVICPVAGCGNRQPLRADRLAGGRELRAALAHAHRAASPQDRSTVDLDLDLDATPA